MFNKKGSSTIKKSLLFGILLLMIGITPISYAYFQDLGMGARPVGMGDAFVAVADDSNAVLWNVAGLSNLKRRELNLMYSDLYSNLNARLFNGENDTLGYHNVGMVMPFDSGIGSFGLTWTLFNSGFYRENTFIISYAREVGPVVFDWLKVKKELENIRFDAGLNLKILNWTVAENQYTATNDVFVNKGLSKTGFTADLGLLVVFPQNIKVGLSLENFLPADVGLTVYETVPINFRLGSSYIYKFGEEVGIVDSVLGSVEFTQRNGISDIRFGSEGWFFNKRAALRLGTTADQFSAGVTYNAPIAKAPISLRFDYAFAYPYGVQATVGSHRISMVVMWGAKKREDYFKR